MGGGCLLLLMFLCVWRGAVVVPSTEDWDK